MSSNENTSAERMDLSILQSEKLVAPQKPTKYPVFRKRFHIPSRWAELDAFRELAEHSYERNENKAAYEYIRKRLKSLNYHSDNKAMIHDYLHFLICDLLDSAKVPFLTEEDLKNAPALSAILNKKTPDLILGPAKPALPKAIDIFVGNSVESVEAKKKKYKGLSIFMEFDVVTFANLRPLACVLPQIDLKYIQEQLAIFMVEYEYWHACLKLQKILFNDTDNVPIRAPVKVTAKKIVQNKKLKLISRLEGLSIALNLFKNGGDDDEEEEEDNDEDDDGDDGGDDGVDDGGNDDDDDEGTHGDEANDNSGAEED